MNALCLVRHGIAAERGAAWPNDRLRPLTPDGIAKMKVAAAGLALIGEPGTVLTSPLVRARQTAEIVAHAFRIHEVIECEALATGDHAELLARAAQAGSRVVYAVGHEPHIGMAASWMLTGDDFAVPVDVKKGAALMIRFRGSMAPGAGYLEWVLQPRLLRAIAKAATPRP